MTPFKWASSTGHRCFFCNSRFETADTLLAHTRETHDRKKFKHFFEYHPRDLPLNVDVTDLRCSLCRAKFSQIVIFKDHLIEEHNKQIVGSICKVIPFELSSRNVCVVCDERLPSFSHLFKHTRNHFNSYICNVCGEEFLTQTLLLAHERMHLGETTCNLCGKVLSNVPLLKSHVRSVHSKDRVRCERCGEKFPNSDQKVRHLVMYHDETRSFPCPTCGKDFLRKNKMELHYRSVHLNLRNFACDICGSAFNSPTDVNHHKKKVHFKNVCP